jgi:hypothetical protein
VISITIPEEERRKVLPKMEYAPETMNVDCPSVSSVTDSCGNERDATAE